MSDVLVERQGHTTIITLHRPEKLNAFTTAMGDELTGIMGEFDRDPDQYVAIITGAGDRAFSSGFDLSEMAGRFGAGNVSAGVSSVDLWGVGSSPKPTIAAVNGLAVAGGFELALNCDIRVAADSAWFGLFEVKRGIMAGVGVNLLARYLPFGEALYLLMTADRLNAEDAARLGLVQRLTPSARLMDTAMGIAEMIGANSQVAVQASKHVAYQWRNLAIREQIELYRAVNQRLLLCEDAVEGARAFVEKRDPVFVNRWPTASTMRSAQRTEGGT
ncbi:MAG: enoyl-CoA hydratase/isomerase family protein [Acidimicrobiaceae bacterium]|nr:enoyl-CoA hydratase/isomerase family protein [Acidimicrobiaceae bacterium]